MRLRLLIEPNWGATYAEIARLAGEAERLGFDGLFCSDHYLPPPDHPMSPRPSDTWTTMAALALETDRLRLGSLLSPVSFRSPGPLAVTVAHVDELSGGRVELGLGAGWHESEHLAYGLSFPPVGVRFEQLAEQLSVITGLWKTSEGSSFAFDGAHYRVEDSPGISTYVQLPHPPIIVGGAGRTKTPQLAARFASEYNVPVRSPDVTRQQFARVEAACSELGRARSTIVFSAAQVICLGTTQAELDRRAGWIGRTPEDLALAGIAGTPEAVLEKAGVFAAMGAERLYLQLLDVTDIDHLRAIADCLLPYLADLATSTFGEDT